MLDPFQLIFVQRGILEIAALAIAAGLIGTWIVLRGVAFYAHAVGTASFPGLVLAEGVGFSAHLGAGGTALAVAGSVGWLARRDRERYDSVTALVLVGALALGVILASDVFHSGANVETLLFGSVLVIGAGDIWFAAAVSGIVLVASLLLEQRWLVTGFDPAAARALGARSALPDVLLLGLIALVAVASLSAIGALLATALLVVPAATTRLVCSRLRSWQIATVALVMAEGVAGLWLAVETNAPPGATIAVISAGAFALVAAGRIVGRRWRPAALALAALLVGAGAAGCGSGAGAGGSSHELKVVATTTQLGDLVRNVGGHRVAVTQILRPNTDPHEYEPRPRDVLDTAGAKLVFESGDNLDTWMAKVVSQSGGVPTIVDVGRVAAVRLPGEASGPEASAFDPHWWHDPVNAERATTAIRDALVRADPAGRAAYDRRARAYLAKLRALNRGLHACFARVPRAQRKLVTDHDAFNYFAHRYGIKVVGAVIPSQTTQAQASAGDVAQLSALIEREHVKAVFPESSINPKLARALAEQTGASASYTLYGDTLGPAGSSGATYLTMEQANADEMLRGFTAGKDGCRVPGL
ncbi:MAG TPA: zinc ABC transporter substrate-binding protein [Solirubrobacteraceae bacterium]|nr:zinc ABC transporter substrate-binding protein [Solirubrobacteraceae bacterium]